jgi:hypothetical protein
MPDTSLEIQIHPVAFSGTDRLAQFRRAKEIAEEIRKIEGVENAQVRELLQKAIGIQNTIDPIITAAIITGASGVVEATITGIFSLLREKREKKDHRETIIYVLGDWHVIKHEADERKVIKCIEAQIKREKEEK